MGRFFAALVLVLALVPAPHVHMPEADPTFFSLLFPQLIPDFMWEDPLQAIDREAVQL